MATGIAVFVKASSYVAEQLGLADLSRALDVVPPVVVTGFGVSLIVVWLPVFISGICALDRRGAVGQSETLRTNGIYRYVRNPMYAGISFTIIGLGFVLTSGGLALAGALWLVLAVIQCKREEKELKLRFGAQYETYKKATPMLIPRFVAMVKDMLVNPKPERDT